MLWYQSAPSYQILWKSVKLFRKTYSEVLISNLFFIWAFLSQSVGVTTSHQRYGSCTGCQSVSALCSRSLVGRAPVYLAHDCCLLSDVGRHPLRSSSNDMRKLLVPQTHNKLGDRSFSAAGPWLWNDLPRGPQRPGLTYVSFKQSLKTHLFGDRSA